MAYVHWKKDGYMDDKHIIFTLRYTERAITFFPELSGHHTYLRYIFLKKIAARRNTSVTKLKELLSKNQLDLF